MEYSPEVLIYLQKFKLYLEGNDDVKKYFLKQTNEEEFFKHFLEISEKNLKRIGQPELTIEQLEFLRITLNIFKKVDTENDIDNDLIYDYTTNKIKFHLK
jgi:hypothetical protein